MITSVSPEIVNYIFSLCSFFQSKDFFIQKLDLEDSSCIEIYSAKLAMYHSDAQNILQVFGFVLDKFKTIFIKIGSQIHIISDLDEVYIFLDNPNNNYNMHIVKQAKFVTVLQNYINLGFTWYPHPLPEDALPNIEKFISMGGE